jgi:DNA topoisomerase II
MDQDLARKYIKLEPRDHVLTRPGMYIGSVESDKCETWVLDESCPGKPAIVKRDITYVPGLYKIYDEIISNAIDHATRVEAEFPDDPKSQVRNIKVTIERDTGIIEVFNDGPGIDVEMHPEHGVYVPELIFGHMLTSANYDDSTDENGEGGRMVGGMNGLGAKCCNIFSEWFEIETVDATRKKIFKQRFRDNMSAKATPSVRACAKRPYTRIRFLPQYSRFGCEGITDDVYALFAKRACDACALTGPGVNVFLNGVKLEYKSFERYVDMYLGVRSERPRVYEKINDRWEVVAAVAEEPGFEHMSFVNGIWTMRGGKHVEYVTAQICKKLCDVLVAKKKLANVRPPFVKERLILFVKCSVTNPMFDSQSKETLTTPATRFGGGKVEVSDAFIDKLSKTGIAELVAEAAAGASAKALAKSDGAKRSTVKGIPKLHDAAWAGTRDKSQDAVLCLVEGDSAAAMAIAGRSAAVNGTQKYGIFSLKGKLLNTRDAALQKIADNAEICAIKRILGLQTGKQYDDTKDLRYGGILLLTDADADGVHIQGLIMNLFGSQWPSLLLCPGFVRAMRTPIVKATKGKAVHQFYDLQEFQRWKGQEASSGSFLIKYYKGLATSSSAEAKEYFRTPRIAEFRHDGSGCSEGLDLAFNKKRADERKAWLEGYEPPGEDGTGGNELDYSQGTVTFDQFVNQGLITFSIYDVARSLPSVVDGLKVSQRKILYACFKRNLVKEIRVAQLSGYVSEATLYHHGK